MAKNPKKINPVPTAVKNYPDQRDGSFLEPHVTGLLPTIFRTDTNKKVLSAVLEDLMQPSSMEDLDFSVGRKTTKIVVTDYLPHTNAHRQLEPAPIVFTEAGAETLNADEIASAWGFNDRTQEPKVPVSVLDLPIDPDKFINWSDYYWIEEGMPVVYINGSTTETFSVQNDIVGQMFFTTSEQGQQNNRRLTLKNGMRIVFRQFPNTLPIDGDLNIEMLSNGLPTQAIPYELTAYDKTNIGLSIDGVLQRVGLDFTLLGSEIQWKSTPPIAGLNIYIHLPDYFITTNADKTIRRWQVTGVGTADGIKLLGRTHQYTNTSYSKATQTLWDKTAVPWDSVEWDGILRGINAKHYITQAPGAENRNANSRTNVWYHKDAISAIAEFLGITFADIVLSSSQAIRPIVEFDDKLELFNHGTTFRAWPNLLIKSNVQKEDFVGLPLKSTYVISGTLQSPILDLGYTNLLDKLRFDPSIRVTVKSGFNTQTAINRADFTDSEISKLYEEQELAKAANRPFKKILYSVGNNKINWLINPPANGEVVTVTYFVNQVPLSSLRILWLVNDANINKILTIIDNGTTTTSGLFETANNGDAVIIDTPIASDPSYLQEYYWKNGVAVKAQTRKNRIQLPTFELYDANQERLSSNPKKPLIISSTIIEPVEGTVMDPESGYKLTFLPSQFDALSSDNPVRNAMFDIVFKHTLHDYSYYTDGDATKAIQGPYGFKRIYKNAPHRISIGYIRAWFQLKSWVIKSVSNVTNPIIQFDSSVWPTYHWSLEVDNGRLNPVAVDSYKTSLAFSRMVGARGEPITIDIHVPDASGSAKVSGYGMDDIDLIFIGDSISFVIPPDAPSHLVLTLDQRSIGIDVINVKSDPRNVKVKLDGIPATYEYNITRNGYTTTAVSLEITGTGNLEIHHQGDVYDTDDHITALPGLDLNPFQTLSLGEFSPSRLVTAMTSAIETIRLSDTQSWIDSSKAIAMNGALMVDDSALRSTWASLKLSPTLQDTIIARSLSAWRWYRKFTDKLETNSNLLDYSSHTPQYNLDRVLNEMLVGVTYSSPDAVTGMAIPTDAMSSAGYLGNGTQQAFKINTGNADLYLGNFGPDIIYVYLNKEQVLSDEYTVEEATKSVKFNTAPVDGTVVDIYHAGEVEIFSGIPASVAKLGFKDAVRPCIITELYGDYSRKVIVRHDGSRIAIYGLDEADPRNQIILELEYRMYNSCVNKYSYAGSSLQVEDRAWNSNAVSVTESSTRAQLEWFDLNNINYRERHEYVNTNPWTWNYYGKSWKKLYIDKFNTYELDKEPWVALGYMYNKPSWWDTHYSWTNTTKRTALEYALYHGIISEPGTPLTVDSTTARKKWINMVTGKTRNFPVDDEGNIMDPMAWGYPQPPADIASLPWEIGSCGPAEMAWRNSIAGQWFNVLFAIDDKKYCNKFFDASMNPFVKPSTLDSPRAKGYSSIAPTPFTQTRPSIGIGALIFEAYREFNLSGETPLNDLLSIDARLQFGMGGFSDGITSLKMYHTKYQLGSYVPEEDFMMTLSPGVPVSQLRYSSVRIEKDDVGYRVYGFDPGQRYFEVFTPTAKSVTSSFPSSRRPIVTSYGEFTEYLDWDTTPVKVHYGDYIENNQALITFLMGLGEFQKSRGLLLEEVNARGTITDWKQAALDALQWINEYWGQDHNCIVGVATADGLKFNHTRGILERLDADLGRTGKVIFDNGKSALATDLLITRDYEPNVDKVVSLNREQIVYVDFKLREYQHVVYVRRTTKFNDLILDLQTGHRLDVLNVSARRTMAWTGRPHARGVSITDTGLLPGFETLTTDILDVHKPEQNAFDVAESRIAKGNVVPSKATVINELIQNRTMAHLYQQGLQSSSGTTLAINALLRNDMIDIPGRKQDVEVNEQWLFTTGNFGNLRGSQVWEIELRKQDFNTTKKVIRFSESNVENLNDNILEYNKKDKRWITRPSQPYSFNKINRATLGLDSTSNWLPNAGVSNLIDTDIQAVTISDVNIDSFRNIDPLNKTISLSASGTITTSDIFSTNSFSRYIDYDPDDLAWNEGKLYRAKVKIVGSSTSAFSADHWNLVEVDSRLLPAIWISDFGYIANSKYRGTWVPNGTLYQVGDLIEYESKNYVCSVEHTSTGSFVSNRLTSVAVTNGGFDYIDNEQVTITGEDGQFSTGKVKTKGGKISSVINVVDNVGGFSANTIVKVLDADGNEHPLSSRAVILPIISPSETKETDGAITSVSVPSTFIGGNNYFADNITVTLNGTGTGAVITPTIATQVATTRIIRGVYKARARDITASGTGYKVGDKMLLSNIGNEFDDAIIEVTAIDAPIAPALSVGRIISFTVAANSLGRKGGRSYKVGKEYLLTNITGTGSGAKITVQEIINFDTGVVIYDTGVITGFTVTSPGTGYNNSTTLTISRAKPRATATVVNGVVTAITVDNQGRGKNMIFGDVEINILPIGNGGGSNARAKANIINGQLTSIDVLAGGAGYSSGARVEVIDPEWKNAVTTTVTLSTGTGNEILTNVVTGVTIIDGGYDYVLTDSIVISDSTRDSLLPNATATVGSLIKGTIYQVDIDQPNTANFYGTPEVTFNSGNNSATLGPVIQSFWNLRATGYGWNVLQTFNPMYVEEACPNALNTGLNESKVTFSNPHGLTTGDYFVLAGANDGNYDKIHKVKAKVDDYNVLIEARSTSDQIVYNLVAFKMQSVRFNSKADYEKSKLTYNWQRGMKAYVDQDPTNTDLTQGNNFNYEFTEIEFGTNVGSTDKIINHSSYLIDTSSIYKVWLLDINTQEILSTIETYDPFKGVIVDDVAQYVGYKTSIDPSIYNVDELGIKDPLVAEAWAKERLGSLWWDTSQVRYIEYELGDVDTRANNWGKKFANTEVVIYEWVSSKELPTAETPGIRLDHSSGIGQIRYVEVEELNEFKILSTVYYYWKRGVSTLPTTSTRPYAAATIEQVLDNPDANGVSWLSPIEVTPDSASLLICNINDYFSNRDSVILRIEQNLQPEQKHTTGVLVAEGFNGGEIPEYLYGRLRDSLVGEDKYRTIEPITYAAPGTTISLKAGDLITFINLDSVEFDFVTSYDGSDVPVLIDINDERPDVKFVWKDNNEPTFGIYRARYDITTGELVNLLSTSLKRVQTAISKNVLKDNRFYAVTDRPRQVPDPLLHPLRRYGNSHVPGAQSWFDNATNARRTFIDCVNDFLLKIDVVSKTGWDTNLRTWRPLLGQKTLHLDPDWAPFYDPNDNLNGYMQLWDYADYALDDYVPGNEEIKLSSLSELPAALLDDPELSRFAVIDPFGVVNEVYDYNSSNLTVVYRKNGTIQIRDLADLAGWDTTRWDSKLWDPSRWDLGQILKALRENIFVGDDAGYFNSMFFAMVKESLVQIPMADWVFKTGYLSVDQTTTNDLRQVALYYNKKDGLIRDYINEVKPYHSKQIDKGTYSKATHDIAVSLDENIVITFIEPEFLTTEVSEDKLIDRRRNGTPDVFQIPQRILTQASERLMVRDHVLTQVIVTEEG